jgi:hypothetical protein
VFSLIILTNQGITTDLAGITKGSEPAEIIVFYAGIQGKPITISKSED